MNELVKVAAETFTILFGDDQIGFIVYLSIFILGILLFREYRLRIIEEQKNKTEKIDIALQALFDLKSEMYIFEKSYKKSEDVRFLKKKIVIALPSLSYELVVQFNTLDLDKADDEAINSIIEKLAKEIGHLKYHQGSVVVALSNRSILKDIDYFIKTKIYPIVMPFVMTMVSILIILFILQFFFTASEIESNFKFYVLIQTLINLLILVFYIVLIASLKQTRRLKNGWKTWIFIIITIILSILVIAFYEKLIILPTIHFLLYVIMFVLLKKYALNQEVSE